MIWTRGQTFQSLVYSDMLLCFQKKHNASCTIKLYGEWMKISLANKTFTFNSQNGNLERSIVGETGSCTLAMTINVTPSDLIRFVAVSQLSHFTRKQWTHISGVRSLKFLTPTPPLLRLILWLRNILSFALQFLLKLLVECYKLFKIRSKMIPAPAFREKRKSGSTSILEIHYDSGRSPLLHSGYCAPLTHMEE